MYKILINLLALSLSKGPFYFILYPLSFLYPQFPEKPCKEIGRSKDGSHGNKTRNRKDSHSGERRSAGAATGKLRTVHKKEAAKKGKQQPLPVGNFG